MKDTMTQGTTIVIYSNTLAKLSTFFYHSKTTSLHNLHSVMADLTFKGYNPTPPLLVVNDTPNYERKVVL